MLRLAVRSIGTLKSKDEGLLERLKYVNLHGGKTSMKAETRPPQEVDPLPRNLHLNKLSRVVKNYISDPIQWNPSILARVFNLPEDACEKLVVHIRPMMYKVTREMDEPEKLLKTSFVIDVGRLIKDKKYAHKFNRISFHK